MTLRRDVEGRSTGGGVVLVAMCKMKKMEISQRMADYLIMLEEKRREKKRWWDNRGRRNW